jgi:hypothetical protein
MSKCEQVFAKRYDDTIEKVTLTGRWYANSSGNLWFEVKTYFWQKPKFVWEKDIRELHGELCG